MRKSNSDTSKVRQVLVNYGYKPYKFYSESRKNSRRVKAWICEVENHHFTQVTKELIESFGNRFRCCYNMRSQNPFRPLVSFVVELKPFVK